MKLYYSPAACSLSPHIALYEAGLKFDAILTSTKSHKLADGTDYYTINALGYVPLLELDDGTRLTEGSAIVQYIADQAPEMNLAPANGTMARYQLQSLLNFISTEIHKGFAPLFKLGMPVEAQQIARDSLTNRLTWIDGQLAGKQYLMGDQFTVADGYLFNVTNWAAFVKLDLTPYANLVAYRARIAARPAVQQAMKAEGLIK
jgi:glutathione S-transferase